MVWPGSLQLQHRRNFFTGGGPEEVDAEMPEVGVVVGVWVVVSGGRRDLGHTRSRTSWGQYSCIVSCKYTCLSWDKPWGGVTVGNECDEGPDLPTRQLTPPLYPMPTGLSQHPVKS